MVFNYNTLKVALDPPTKGLHILLDRPSEKHTLNAEMLFELEGLLSWPPSHLEINTIYLSSTSDFFCDGFDFTELKSMEQKKLHKYLVRFQKLMTVLQHLPQTILCDIKGGAKGVGIELAMACDLRIAQKNGHINFNSLQQGWVPCGGGVFHLTQLVGLSRAKQWLLSSARISSEHLTQAGFLLNHYDLGQNLGQEILQTISTQAPVSRIQTKRCFLESSSPEWERGQQYELSFALGGLASEDWKRKKGQDFINARQMAEKIKLDTFNRMT